MKKTFITLALSALTVLMVGAPAFATEEDPYEEEPVEQVCEEGDSGKIDLDGGTNVIELSAPDGFLISGYCVKAGSANQEDGGPEYYDVDPAEKTVTFQHSTGKEISHYSLYYVEIACEEDGSCEPIYRERNEVDEWETEEFECGDTTVIESRGTYTYTEVSYDNGLTWEDESATGSIEVRERDLTEEELASLGDCTEVEERERTTETEWVDGEFECDDTTVTQTRTVTTVTERSTDGGETWEAVASSTRTEERSRDLTDDEITDCPEEEVSCEDDPDQEKCDDEIVEIVCAEGLKYNEATGKCELPDSGFGSVLLALTGLLSIGGGTALLRKF